MDAHTSRSMVSLVTDQEEFLILKEQFGLGINAHPDLQEEAAVINDESFQFWLYLALNVRHGMTNIYMISLITWIMLLVFFIMFCFLHIYAHLAWIRLFCFFGTVFVLAFLFMFWKVHSRVVELDQSADSHEAFKGDSFAEKYNTEAWIGTVLQFTIFFCCYGVARILVSPWLWEFYFWYALLCVVGFVVFAILFRLFCAPLLVVFLVIMALPPHLDPVNLAILKEVKILSKEKIGMDHPSAREIPDR